MKIKKSHLKITPIDNKDHKFKNDKNIDYKLLLTMTHKEQFMYLYIKNNK